MLNLRHRKTIKFLTTAKKHFEYSVQTSRREQKDIERLFARVFSTDDGQKLLAYLSYTTFQRAFGANATDEQLRYVEGQRALVATIIRFIDRGRQG